MQGPDPSHPPEPPGPAAPRPSAGEARPDASDRGHERHRERERERERESHQTIRSGSGSATSDRSRAKLPAILPQAGDRLDFFELQRPIGAGGMGAVFLALDIRLDRFVALKVLPPDQAADPEVIQRFYQEARAAARLDHEHIARVFTIGQDGPYHFIAFEFIEGTTLRDRVDRLGPLGITEAINLTLQIAEALTHASDRGVVHRDIKPSNIVINSEGRAKLVDMGLARHFERGGDDGLTQSGMTLGTFDYISPEQARDPRDVDVRSDLYSLGCTLFHILTGRPPFPEGTVLQKLLQHQADDPPDVRELNPAVPPSFATILSKLMAKDRDRRHQSPEQLSRDLLVLAASLGLRAEQPETLAWSAPKEPARDWQRHLYWGLPAMALASIVAALFWWTPDPAASDGSFDVVPTPRPSLATSSSPATATTSSSTATSTTTPTPIPTTAPVVVPEAALARDVRLRARDDLAAALASAPSGSRLILVEDGDYDLRPGPTTPRPQGAAPSRRDLTLRAAPGVHPVLRSTGGRSSLLEFGPGHVLVEGLTLVLGSNDRPGPIAALRALDTDLILNRCTFTRLTGPKPAAASSAIALDLHASRKGSGDPTPLVRASSCVFGPGQVGVATVGPVRASLVDCSFAGASPAFETETPAGTGPESAPAELDLSFVNLQAGEGPAFYSLGTPPRVRVIDSILAPSRDAASTLFAAAAPDRLDWWGRGNLYGRFRGYLQATQDLPGSPPPIQDFDAWASDPASPRESGSASSSGPIWADGEPTTGPRLISPSLVPTAATTVRLGQTPGSRSGPDGPLGLARSRPATPSTSTAPAEAVSTLSPLPEPQLVPKRPNAPRRTDNEHEADDPLNPWPRFNPRAAADLPSAQPEIVAPTPATDLVRTPAQLQESVDRLGPARGGTIRISPDAELSLPPTDLPPGRWIVQAEPGPRRPRLRLRPANNEGLAAENTPIGLFRLRSGSLQIKGIDFLITRDDGPGADPDRRAAFVVAAGTDLEVLDSTVTANGDPGRAAVVAIPPTPDEPDDPASPSATVRIQRSILRGNGDLIDISPGRRIDLELKDDALGAGGALVHAHGVPRDQPSTPLKLVIRHVTARLLGGLVRLESTPAGPLLPVAEISAWDSILATGVGTEPLIRVEGQGTLDELRDRVRWDGHSVVYHQLRVYRRDQTQQLGELVTPYDRRSWEMVANDDMAAHGDAHFAHPWAPETSPATLSRDDVQLDPAGGLPPNTGVDPSQLPPSPPS